MVQRRRRGRPPGPTSRRSAILTDLSRKLSSGEWPVGKPIPSYRRLAAKYRVCVTTIRLVLKTLAREGRLNIRPRRNPVAALGTPLAEMMDGAVAMVLKDQLFYYLRGKDNALIWRGLTQGLLVSNSPFVVLQHWKLWRTAFPAGLRDLPLSGVVLLGPFNAEIIRQYETLKVPVVLLDQPGEKYKIHSVCVANYEAAFDATLRLIAAGHRRLAFVRTVLASMHDIDPDARVREAGFLAACKRRKLKREQYRVFSAILSTTFTPAVRELIHTEPRFTAVLCTNNVHALQAAKAAEELGLKVPRDLSVITFRSEHGYTRDWSGPQIDFESIGQKGAEILHRNPKTIEHAYVPTIWNEGDSFGPLRK